MPARKQSLSDRFERWTDRTGPCWLWTGALFPNGYAKIKVEGRTIGAHRATWEALHGPTHLHVLHTCDTPACVNPAHLFLGTNQDNVDDKVEKGRQALGENHRLSKLTAAEAQEICDRYQGTEVTQQELADAYRITQSHISAIVRKTAWVPGMSRTRRERLAAA